jgi:hypothetical protein
LTKNKGDSNTFLWMPLSDLKKNIKFIVKGLPQLKSSTFLKIDVFIATSDLNDQQEIDASLFQL